MPKGIKTRNTIKNIKTIDKSVNLGKRMKNSFIRAKKSAESTQSTDCNSPTEYATDKISTRAESLTHQAKRKLSRPYQKSRNSMERAKEHFRAVRNQTPKAQRKSAGHAQKTYDTAKKTAGNLQTKATQTQKAAETAKTVVTDAKHTLQQTRQAGRMSIQTVKTFNTSGKGTIKTVKKSVKTAERTAKATVKTAQHAARKAQQTAKATAKASKLAARASRAAAKTAAKTAKVAVKSTIAIVKATIATIKGLIAVIAASGWVVVLIILIICLIGLIVGSIFGIFFSNEDNVTGRAMSDVVSQLTMEFYEKAEEIKRNNTYDVLYETALHIDWREVLAVYAVKINDAAEVVTLDDDKIDTLRTILNDMATLSYTLRDGTLTITLAQKSINNIVTEYNFTQAQRLQIDVLLSAEYDELWDALLGSYAKGNGVLMNPDGSYIPTDIFTWPMGEGFRITSHFGYRTHPISKDVRLHGGVDISAPLGTPILAAADGIVTVANATDSWGGGYGYYVKLSHDGGFVTVYAHCSQIAVKKGQEVKAGEVIAYVGSTGNSTGPHLHFEVHKNGTKKDPLEYFD